MIDLSTKISQITFPGCIMNASGTVVSLDELKTVLESDAVAVVMKTCTMTPREGNKKPRYSELSLGSVQCMGLPNHGYKASYEYARELKKLNTTNRIIASVACSSNKSSIVLRWLKSFMKIVLLILLK